MAESLLTLLLKFFRDGWPLFKQIVIRSYAFVIMVVVLYAGYAAVSYLIHQVFFPSPVPQRLLEWQGHLEADALNGGGVPGVATRPLRAPLGHYHGIKGWFQPDAENGCTTSGCHKPLPHQKTKTVRAFANFHSMFLDCMTCHRKPEDRPVKVLWVDTDTGDEQEPPAILQLIRFLQRERDLIERRPEAAHQTVVELLGGVVGSLGEDNVLRFLLLQIETSMPASPVWRHAMEHLAEEIPRHARGKYGAKVVVGDASLLRVRNRALIEQAGQYLAAEPGSDERERLNQQMHSDIVLVPDGCMSCHDAEGPSHMGLDLVKLGYSDGRIQQLQDMEVARMAEQVRQGRPWYLPNLMEGGLPESLREIF
jgi:hypothetical protein